mmetsp:Transcript_77238/g.238435  ORF Transcript_77238/g.238435 Transcript_77238/m.238435 type:complete len:257 (-) Transcript_77238:510-1280(-)
MGTTWAPRAWQSAPRGTRSSRLMRPPPTASSSSSANALSKSTGQDGGLSPTGPSAPASKPKMGINSWCFARRRRLEGTPKAAAASGSESWASIDNTATARRVAAAVGPASAAATAEGGKLQTKASVLHSTTSSRPPSSPTLRLGTPSAAIAASTSAGPSGSASGPTASHERARKAAASSVEGVSAAQRAARRRSAWASRAAYACCSRERGRWDQSEHCCALSSSWPRAARTMPLRPPRSSSERSAARPTGTRGKAS